MNPAAVIASLEETYNQENSYLLAYLKKQPFESSDLHTELADYWDGWGDALEAVGSSTEEFEALLAADNMDAAWEICYRLDDWMDQNPSYKEDAAMALMQHAPSEAPTWAHLDLNVKRLLPASTWMAHWSNKADAIAAEGFTQGVFDLTRLGLTTYNRRSIRGPGYNFAFQLDSQYADNPELKYGSECVVFQSSGVECSHGGDDEDQCIFWGPGITTKPVLVNRDRETDKWCVRGANGVPLVRFEDVDSCFSWIKAYSGQYRKKLAFRPR